MQSINLKSLTGFKYANRMLSAGDEFTATNAHGRLLVALRKASYVTKAEPSQQPRKSEPEPIADTTLPEQRKPNQKRRKPKKETVE